MILAFSKLDPNVRIREVILIELYPSNMKRKDGSCLSKTSKLLICSSPFPLTHAHAHAHAHRIF
jgi:hypothetical protein